MTNMILMKKKRERIREDMQLFIDYYRNLWIKKVLTLILGKWKSNGGRDILKWRNPDPFDWFKTALIRYFVPLIYRI